MLELEISSVEHVIVILLDFSLDELVLIDIVFNVDIIIPVVENAFVMLL